MAAIDLWKLSTEYTVVHAALLIAGYSPDEAERHRLYDLGSKCPGYRAAITALCSALTAGALQPLETIYDYDEDGDRLGLDTTRTLISIAELNRFVRARGHTCEFFEPRTGPTGLATGAGSPYFSKKLDAANRAWVAVTQDPTRMLGRSPKRAIEEWLTEHAAELGLLNRAGEPNRTGIEEIAKVANWKPEGGATPTPSLKAVSFVPSLVQLPAPREAEPREDFSADLDDEIPF